MTLLSLDEVRRAAKTYSRTSGVYFLFKGDDLVYVGQSVDVHARLKHHRGAGFLYTQWWDRVAVIECAPRRLEAMENAYILALKPRFNLVCKEDGKQVYLRPQKRRAGVGGKNQNLGIARQS